LPENQKNYSGYMKSNWLRRSALLLFVCALSVQLHAQNDGKWFDEIRVKAENGDAASQSKLAHAYFNGWGVDRDADKAIRWLRKAAEQGRVSSQTELGTWLWLGPSGSKDSKILKNPAEAAVWFLRAAAENEEEAIFSIGVMYAKGEGVSRNLIEGYKWLDIAARFPEKPDSDQLMSWPSGNFKPKTPSIPEQASKVRD